MGLVKYPIVCLVLGILVQCNFVKNKDIAIEIETEHSLCKVSEHYLSIALDTHLVKQNWKGFNFSSVKLQTLSKALIPCYIRLGGTDADFLVFNSSIKTSHMHGEEANIEKDDTLFTMTAIQWDSINKFVKLVGWNLIFDFNVMLRKDGRWNPTNAIEILKYSFKRGYKMDFELGNEPNLFKKHYNISIGPDELGKDFTMLSKYIKSFELYQQSRILGPDVTRPFSRDITVFLKEFVQEAEPVLDAITFHHYYFDGRTATLANFLDPIIFDSLGTLIDKNIDVIKEVAPDKDMCIGETATAWGGGAPGLSDTYVAGFMWLDKLGLSATKGIQVVMRQSLYGGNYSLLDEHLNPRPDYWLSLIYKNLVGSTVLTVNRTNNTKKPYSVRIYSHCTAHRMGYERGAVTVYIANMDTSIATIRLPDYLVKTTIDEYLLESAEIGNIQSKYVNLNGVKLEMQSETEFPHLAPRTLKYGDNISVPPFSFGFWVLPAAKAAVCL